MTKRNTPAPDPDHQRKRERLEFLVRATSTPTTNTIQRTKDIDELTALAAELSATYMTTIASKEIPRIHRLLKQEADRGCVLVAAAYIDEQLEILLRAHLIDDKKTTDEILTSDGILKTFSARIKLCFALGLIPRDTYRDINLIRAIRNSFAHLATDVSFESPEVKQRIDQMSKPRSASLKRLTADKNSTRQKFMIVVMQTTSTIMASIAIAAHRKEMIIPKDGE